MSGGIKPSKYNCWKVPETVVNHLNGRNGHKKQYYFCFMFCAQTKKDFFVMAFYTYLVMYLLGLKMHLKTLTYLTCIFYWHFYA